MSEPKKTNTNTTEEASSSGGKGDCQATPKKSAQERRRPLLPASAIWVSLVLVAIALLVGMIFGRFLLPADVAQEQGGGPGGGGMPPALVAFAQVVEKPLQDRVAVVGRLEPLRRATVSAEVEGVIVEMLVETGSQVSYEQVLARIDPVWSGLSESGARATLRSTQSILTREQIELRFLENLSANDSGRRKELEDAKAAVSSAVAATQAAQASVDLAVVQVSKTTVLAPFDSYVIEKHAELGERMEPGEPVVELVSRGKIDAVIDVPERLIGQVKVGDDVEIIVDAVGVQRVGSIVSIRPDADNAARTFEVKVRLDEQGVLKAGMSVTARLGVGDTASQLTVPRDAVQFDDRGAVVWVSIPPDANPAGQGQQASPSGPPPMPTALPVPVKVLYGVGNDFAVLPLGDSGDVFRAGADVVIRGAERLAPGQPLVTGKPTPPSSTQPEERVEPASPESADAQAPDSALPRA